MSCKSCNSPGDSNDLLVRKYKKIFNVLDIDGDGVLTRNDYKELGDRFAAASHVSDAKKAEIKKKFLDMWTSNFEEKATISLQFYLDVKLKLAGAHQRLLAEAAGPIFFEAVDLDGDGLIQLEEFRKFFALTKGNDADADKAFKLIDTNSDGKLSNEEFCHGFVEFFGSKDPNSPFNSFFGPI